MGTSKNGYELLNDMSPPQKCCAICAGSCCCFLLSLIGFLVWFLHGAPGGRYLPIGANGLNLGFASDMISLKTTADYTQSWCDGDVATCTTKVNFPGQDTTSYMDWETVWSMGAQYPQKEWSGEWWRGNELGFIINNPKFWSGLQAMSPMSIALGILPSQHAQIRPIMEDMWDIGTDATQEKYKNAQRVVDGAIRTFLQDRTEIDIQTDITILVHKILNKLGLKRDISEEYAAEFVAVQGRVVALGTLSQLIPTPFVRVALSGLVEEATKFVAEYIPLIQELYGEELGHRSCQPSENCTVQAAHATFDALYAAGGLSVPSGISTGLATLYSTDASNPFAAKEYAKNESLNFFWEALRYFPPVVGFPHWTTRPTCAGSTPEATAALNKPDGKSEACPLGSNNFFTGYPDVNQYAGGVRAVPNLAIAQRDPRKWGPDAASFRIRPLQDYSENSVGFAEMAVDSSVAGGAMNRVCPGKQLALMIGESFFRQFNRDEWEPSTEGIAFTGVTPFIDEFKLQKKGSRVGAIDEEAVGNGMASVGLGTEPRSDAQENMFT
eukprot:TRINITY_DN31272_c0_g1_i1.p1 TRINITY_DN31272_c0_g1~~TRINITY_DN31272_c0_g1_i1.p1  ORF type:complete len:579 (+),score=102.70 TRINITY_DN31272_c0_g1_i1:80-1738(+)